MKYPIPTDTLEQLDWARSLAHGFIPPDDAAARALPLTPRERIAILFPLGLEEGAVLALRLAQRNNVTLPQMGRSAREDRKRLWAQGLASAATLPPTIAFNGGPKQTIPAIYRGGIARGIILALEALGLRPKGGA